MAEHALSTPTRRNILSGAVAATTALLAAPTALAAEHPDAELLHVLARFDALERQINVSFEADDPSGADDERRDREIRDPLRDMQAPLVDRICQLRARTPEGLRARALVAMGEDLELRRRVLNVDANGSGWCVNTRFLAALLRDLTGEA